MQHRVVTFGILRAALFVTALASKSAWAIEPFIDSVVTVSIGTQGGFNASQLPGVVLGAPVGSGMFGGSIDVFSLGLGGSIELEFSDNLAYDGPGPDIIVFENPFLTIDAGFSGPPFSEPGRVSVSQDGLVWHAFPCALDLADAPYFPGCAGVYPVLSNGTPPAWIPTLEPPIEDLVGLPILELPLPDGSGGDRFDLADVGLAWAKYVRIEAASFSTGPAGTNNAGFDLDAVVAVHTSPPAVPTVPGPGWLGALMIAIVGASRLARSGWVAAPRLPQ